MKVNIDSPNSLGFSKVIASTLSSGDASDSDGYTPNAIIEKTSGSVTGDWYYMNNTTETQLSSSERGKTFETLINEGIMPYYKISGDIILTTQYGDPNKQSYPDSNLQPTPVTKVPQRKFYVSQVNYLKPLDMKIYKGLSSTNSAFPNDGYNTAVFNPTKGFKADAGFPTTGFVGAEFDILSLGTDQSNYKCKTTSSDITLSGGGTTSLGTNCHVKYISKFTSPITIEVEYNGVFVDSYTIPTPTKWAKFGGRQKYNTQSNHSGTYNAAKSCGAGTLKGRANEALAASYFYTRADITNSPKKTITGNSSVDGKDRFSRDVDGSFQGEWGYLSNYTNSGWAVYSAYWTDEALNSCSQFAFNVAGYVGGNSVESLYHILCKFIITNNQSLDYQNGS